MDATSSCLNCTKINTINEDFLDFNLKLTITPELITINFNT